MRLTGSLQRCKQQNNKADRTVFHNIIHRAIFAYVSMVIDFYIQNSHIKSQGNSQGGNNYWRVCEFCCVLVCEKHCDYKGIWIFMLK
jgi:hypothetical protein